MVQLAIASNPHFGVSRVDLDRPGPSYSVDMVQALQQELGPGAELSFVMGLDSLFELQKWYHPEQLLRLVNIVAVTRPGYASGDFASQSMVANKARHIEVIAIPQLDISASELRQRVADGRPIRYQVPEAVEQYIYRQGLYRV
jgi:nicotinate-nucleotide adenylyltransferase